MTQEVALAYIAGLIDGEGCIRVKKSKAYRCQHRVTPGYDAVIQIRMVDEGALTFIAETLGGWYYMERKNTPGRRPLYCYQATGKKAEAILRALLPYLRVKREAAINALALRDLKAEAPQHRLKVIGTRNFPNQHGTVRVIETRALSDEFVARCETLYTRSRDLNRVGPRRDQARTST